MKLASVDAPAFRLAETLESGQVFHWQRDGAGWKGLIGDVLVRVRQDRERLLVTPGTENLVRSYFALDHGLEAMAATFPGDAYMRAAVEASWGLRVMRQPRWECLATFITSSLKQVSHIRQISLLLRERYGRRVAGSRVRAYPEPGRLVEAGEAELRACGLGFRAKSLLGTARMVDEGAVELEALEALPTPELRAVLCGLPGVGDKIANCVLLFAYERLDAVPVDVWIARVLRGMRGDPDSTQQQLEAFCREQLGPYAGYAQQYLFHHARISRTLPGA